MKPLMYPVLAYAVHQTAAVFCGKLQPFMFTVDHQALGSIVFDTKLISTSCFRQSIRRASIM